MRSLVFVVAVVLVGCQLEKLNPGAVGMGVARLSVRNAAAITSVLAEDTSCGFAAPSVKSSPKVTGAVGQLGSATWTVERCTLDLGDLHVISKDCRDVETRIGGKVIVSATRTVEGMVTGNPNNPVVPTKPDAITVSHTAELDGFVVERSDSKASMKLLSGTLAWDAHARLAVGVSTGLCTVPTNELGITGLTWGSGKAFIDSGERRFEVEVMSSKLDAQLGKWGDDENMLKGEVNVWGTSVMVPLADDKDGLDPEYDAEAFTKAYACKADLLQPVSRTCPTMAEKLAQGAAQLSVAAFGTIASVVDDDTRCGFASQGVLAAAQPAGTIGSEGSVTFRITTPCALSWSAPTAVKTYCDGVARKLDGTVRVTGTKTVRGWLTGDVAQPVIPTTRDAASVTLSLDFGGLTYSDTTSERGLEMKSGTLTGELGSRLALDTATGACSIKSPVVYFRGLTWADGQLVLHSGADGYPLHVTGSHLDAQSGAREDHTNWLWGDLEADGTKRPIPVAGEPVLDPSYDAAKFDASWACTPNLRVPQSDEECSFKQTLAQNAARLIVQTAGTVAAMINRDTSCGFDNTLNKLNPTSVVGSPPMIGSMTWAVNACGLRPSGEVVVDSYCTGGKRYVSGQATVTGRRQVVGERETILLLVPGIIPRTHDAVTLELTDVTLSNFSAWSVAPGATAPSGKLELHSGKLFSTLNPILGERTSAPGKFDVPTPVAAFSSISLENGRATLTSGAKTFTLDLQSVQLVAQAGSFKGKSNTVSGTVKLNGTMITVPAIGLDPTFQQAPFDMSYACTMDLLAPIPAN